MRRILITALALLVIFPIMSGPAPSDEPKKPQPPQDKLVGTWRLVSAKFGAGGIQVPGRDYHGETHHAYAFHVGDV